MRQIYTSKNGRRRSLPEMVEWFERRPSRFPLVVAEMGQLVIGFGHLDPSIHGLDSVAQLSLEIDPHFAGRQVEDILVGELLATAERMGLKSVVSILDSSDLVGLRLHHRFGFSRHGEIKVDRWTSMALMQRMLAPIPTVAEPRCAQALPGV